MSGEKEAIWGRDNTKQRMTHPGEEYVAMADSCAALIRCVQEKVWKQKGDRDSRGFEYPHACERAWTDFGTGNER